LVKVSKGTLKYMCLPVNMDKSHTVQNLDALSTIVRSAKLANVIIKSAEETLIDAIAECALQIVKGTVPVSEKSKAARLQEILPFIKFLSKKSVSRRRKRNFLLRGGSALLTSFLPQVINYVTRHL